MMGLRHLLNKKILTNRRDAAFFVSNFMYFNVVFPLLPFPERRSACHTMHQIPDPPPGIPDGKGHNIGLSSKNFIKHQCGGFLCQKPCKKAKICLITRLLFCHKHVRRKNVSTAQRNVTMSSSSRYFFGVMP